MLFKRKPKIITPNFLDIVIDEHAQSMLGYAIVSESKQGRNIVFNGYTQHLHRGKLGDPSPLVISMDNEQMAKLEKGVIDGVMCTALNNWRTKIDGFVEDQYMEFRESQIIRIPIPLSDQEYRVITEILANAPNKRELVRYDLRLDEGLFRGNYYQPPHRLSRTLISPSHAGTITLNRIDSKSKK